MRLVKLFSLCWLLLLPACGGDLPATPATRSVAAPATAPRATVPQATAYATAPEGSPERAEAPALLYLGSSSLLRRRAGAPEEEWAWLRPDGGPVLDARLVGEGAVVLREAGVEWSAPGDDPQWLLRFERPALGGAFLATTGGRTLFSAQIDDPAAEFGFSSTLGLLDADGRLAASRALTFNAAAIGLHSGDALFVVPLGQDPTATRLLLMPWEGDPDEIPVPGGFSRVWPSPTDPVTIAYESPGGVVFDAYEGTTGATVFEHSEWAALKLLTWTHGGKVAYFALDGIPGAALSQSGLFVWSLTTGVEPVEAVSEARQSYAARSSGGSWLVYWLEGNAAGVRVGLSGDGSHQSFPLPAVLRSLSGDGGRLLLSEDGRWLWVEGDGSEASMLVDLENRTAAVLGAPELVLPLALR